jgi:hypothetical protein
MTRELGVVGLMLVMLGLMFTILALILSVLSAPAAERPGLARWALKTQKPQAASSVLVPIDWLLSLPPIPGVNRNDVRYQSRPIDWWHLPLPPGCASSDCPAVEEGILLRTHAWLHLAALEADGDYHLQVSADAKSQARCLIVEIPRPATGFVADRAFWPALQVARAFVARHILRGRESAQDGTLVTPPRLIEITGALFYDDAHVGDPPRGKKGCRSPTLWGLHPVTGIALVPR